MSTKTAEPDGSGEERTIRASISFPESQYQLLEKVAAEHRVSLAWVVRDAVSQYMQAKWPLLSTPKTTQ
jgi:hypothetical protein